MSKLKRQKSKGVPLVITFHPKLKLTGQLSSKHLHMSYMDRAFNKVYTPGPRLHFIMDVSLVVTWYRQVYIP